MRTAHIKAACVRLVADGLRGPGARGSVLVGLRHDFVYWRNCATRRRRWGLTNFRLFDPARPLGTVRRRSLERVAAFLNEQRAGAVVGLKTALPTPERSKVSEGAAMPWAAAWAKRTQLCKRMPKQKALAEDFLRLDPPYNLIRPLSANPLRH
jgi:hypothetical protein